MDDNFDIPKLGTNRSEPLNKDNGDGLLIPKINPEARPIEEVVIKTDDTNKEIPMKKKKFMFRFPKGKKAKIAGGVLGVVLILFLITGLLSLRVYKSALEVKASVDKVEEAMTQQDLDKVGSELEATKEKLKKLQSAYKGITWLRIVPVAGAFIADGQHGLNAAGHSLDAASLLVDAVEPYSDLIGFKAGSEQAQSGAETTQERIDFIIKTLPDIVPKADELSKKAALIKAEVDKIEVDKYPEELFGKKIKENVIRGKELADLATNLAIKGKPLIEVSPYLLGVDNERRYIVIFQNDKELRPTGGFITAYSEAKVNKGRFEPVSSDDIYNLDNQYKPSIKAADPVVKYLKGPYLVSPNLRLRDMNWNPDFSESMELFTEEIKSVGISDIDGIIAVDTQALVNLLNVLGPIGVPGFGDFSTNIVPECNCPQVIYELESFADVEGPIVWSENEPGKIVFAPPNYDNRKKIIGPLMNSVLANALGQPKEKLPALFEAGMTSLLEKHVILYVHDEQAQKAIESFGIGATVDEFEGDYLHINDANLGGRKSNLYVTQDVLQEIEVGKDGSVTKTLTITYKNPEKHDGWLNSILPNWLRVYVPKGSELISFEGVEAKEDPYEDLGKTVFAGYFEIRPQGVSKVTLKYKLPTQVEGEYKLLIQKQSGTDAPLYSIVLGKKKEEFFLRSDKQLGIRI